MLVKILGSAAGGGFPQWNCACPNCSGVRAGTVPAKARTQTQVAVSADGRSWFLLGASPDLRSQIEATPELHAKAGQGNSGQREARFRHSPIAGVVLANADIDHALGLLLLRELQPLRVYSTASVRRILAEDNSMFAMLQRVPGQSIWNSFTAGETFPLLNPAGADSGLRCRAISLGTHYPAYVSADRKSRLDPVEASLGLLVESSSGKRLAYLPAVPQLEAALETEIAPAALLLFDGTFWSDDELIRIRGSGQTARQMGHVPVSSPEGSLCKLARTRGPRKIYLHINNTNPMLNESGPEYRQVRESGWEIAEDGWRFEL
jgi:pyrroloquinoline quinone biosynthesis protein B